MFCLKALRVRRVFLALSVAGLLISAIANPVQGAPQTTFPRAYFDNAQPATALDMIKLLPGFQLHQGDSSVRGYSGSVGNVLIDGQRPASKEPLRRQSRALYRAGLASAASCFERAGFVLALGLCRWLKSKLADEIAIGMGHRLSESFGEGCLVKSAQTPKPALHR
jgi:hypothetical protein